MLEIDSDYGWNAAYETSKSAYVNAVLTMLGSRLIEHRADIDLFVQKWESVSSVK